MIRSAFEERFSAMIALFVVAMIPFAFTLLLFNDLPQATRDIVMVLVGAMVANATQAVQHRFGSTPASQRKDDTIATLANTASSAQAALAPVPGSAPGPTIALDPGQVATVAAKEDAPP